MGAMRRISRSSPPAPDISRPSPPQRSRRSSRPWPDGLFMVGATMIESDQGTRISARSMLELLSAAYALHPAFGEAEIVEIGTGVRAAFADNLPRLRRHGETLYVNGLYRHGFLIAPALARRAADVVLHGRHFPEVMDADPRQRRLA